MQSLPHRLSHRPHSGRFLKLPIRILHQKCGYYNYFENIEVVTCFDRPNKCKLHLFGSLDSIRIYLVIFWSYFLNSQVRNGHFWSYFWSYFRGQFGHILEKSRWQPCNFTYILTVLTHKLPNMVYLIGFGCTVSPQYNLRNSHRGILA